MQWIVCLWILVKLDSRASVFHEKVKKLQSKAEIPINRLLCGLYLLLLLSCFLLFKQSDLTHTYTSSYAYLNGHFEDFYDYNKNFLGRNDYLPLLYIFFALWFIPLKIFQLLPVDISTSWQITSSLEIIWAKLLLTLFFIGSLIQIFRLAKLLSDSQSEAKTIALIFATSPFVVFAVFIFSQYDIISVYFVLLGLTAYFQRRLWSFVLWFSLAISLKYFALIIFIPLILLVEKRIKFLIIYCALALLPTFLQVAFYWHSEIFINEIFSLAGGKVGDAMGRKMLFFSGACYFILCAYCFFGRINLIQQKKTWYAVAILSSLLAYALMFISVRWHPHWLVIISPFICLAYIFIEHKRLLITIELLAYLGFLIICVNTWENNADIAMLYMGVFGDFVPKTTLIGRDLLSAGWMPISRVFFYLYLFSPLIIIAMERCIKRIQLKEAFLSFLHDDKNHSNDLNLCWYITRGIVGTFSFTLLCLLCIFLGDPTLAIR